MSEAELLKPADVAARAQISTKTVLRAIHSGRLLASRLGEHGAFRIKPEDYDAWIEASTVEPPAGEPSEPATSLRALPSGVGRLVLTPGMGRPSS